MEGDLAEFIQVGVGPAGDMVVLVGCSLVVEGILAVAALRRVVVRIACFC